MSNFCEVMRWMVMRRKLMFHQCCLQNNIFCYGIFRFLPQCPYIHLEFSFQESSLVRIKNSHSNLKVVADDIFNLVWAAYFYFFDYFCGKNGINKNNVYWVTHSFWCELLLSQQYAWVTLCVMKSDKNLLKINKLELTSSE